MARTASSTKMLAPYRAKRDFSKTTEPSGRPSKPAASTLMYLIQKHSARALHYDLRLELDGALKSWAVTKGPSLDPSDKRLAVHVEDHPIEYGSFEGIIPKGEYGGGTVMLWDQGTWAPVDDPHKGYAKGHLSFILHGKRLKGEWHLVRMAGRARGNAKRDNWLLIKGRDAFATPSRGNKALEKYQTSSASDRTMEQIAEDGGQPIQTKCTPPRAGRPRTAPSERKVPSPKSPEPPPDFIAPQLATLVTKPPEGPNWVHEIKFDGYRALARIDNGNVRMLTRANNDWTRKFQPIADELRNLPVQNALIDGEIVVFKDDGTMSFNALQMTLGGERIDAMHYAAFDLLFLNGQDLRPQSLDDRKKRLREIIPERHLTVHYSEDYKTSGAEMFRNACTIKLEGIVSKRIDAPYVSGRTKNWLKTKCINEQEFVIGGFTFQDRHPRVLAALLLGYYQDDDLIFVGKVGTGFTQEESMRLLKRLEPDQTNIPPFKNVPRAYQRGAVWVKPKLAAEVSFLEWTPEGALRHPSYHGLREDKPVRQITREKTAAPPDSDKKTPPQQSRPPKEKIVIAGVTITHPNKLMYPDQGITKLEVVQYYETIAPHILPHVAGRPISLFSCHEGMSGNSCYFRRHKGQGFPAAIKTVPIAINERQDYLVIHDLKGLISLAQMGVLEIHIWGTHVDHHDFPDRMVFDLDPAEDVAWGHTQKAALTLRERLKKHGLTSFLLATGGKGLHVVVPLEPKADWATMKAFALAISKEMVRVEPHLFTVSPRKTDRHGKIFIDYIRNTKGSSSIAPFSTRAKAGAPVATPLSWRELKDINSGHPFTLRTVFDRLKKKKTDPWNGMEKLRQIIPSYGGTTKAGGIMPQRRHSPSASADVKREMHKYKEGTLRSGPKGRGGKVKSRKQAIAIGLSEARREGKKVPPPRRSSGSTASRRTSSRGTSRPARGASRRSNAPRGSRSRSSR